MVAVLLIAGIGLLLAGLVTVSLGIQLDLSFGNTLILAGAVVACTGTILLGLCVVVRELRKLARPQPGSGLPLSGQASEDGGFPFKRDEPAVENAGGADPAAQPGSPPPWLEGAASRDRGRSDASVAPEPAEAAPAPKPRRNLLFSSSSRKERERERAQARVIDPSALEIPPDLPAASPVAEPSPPPPASFDDAWPTPERARTSAAPPPRRSGRTPPTFAEPGAVAAVPDLNRSAAGKEDPPQVTVLKSGVVDGMAYSLYSDGSIEAQMPEGMMRFTSIDELRSHLDQRP